MEVIEHSEEMLKQAINQLTAHWRKAEQKFCSSMEDTPRRKLNLKLDLTLDCSENTPVVTTDLSWKDNDTEVDLKVVKTYHTTQIKTVLPDPSQPELLEEEPHIEVSATSQTEEPEGKPIAKRKRAARASAAK